MINLGPRIIDLGLGTHPNQFGMPRFQFRQSMGSSGLHHAYYMVNYMVNYMLNYMANHIIHQIIS